MTNAIHAELESGTRIGGALVFGAGPLVFTLDGIHRQSDDYEIPAYPESARQLAE
jgi:iron complex outermembrane receptor protein